MRDHKIHQSQNNVIELSASCEERVKSAWNSYARGKPLETFRQLIQLIDEGCDEAYVSVGAFYEKGCPGLDIDYLNAHFYYARAIETRGSVEAYLGLARLYYYGLGVSKDYCKAFEYYERVAKEAEQNGIAYLMLGKMYQNGQCVSQDYKSAKECYLKSWEKKQVWALTCLAKLESDKGEYLSSIFHRLKAGITAYLIARKNPHDGRLRKEII